MTLPRMEAIAKRWEKIPAASVSLAHIASFLGVKVAPPRKTSRAPQGRQSLFEDLMASGVKPGRRPEWLDQAMMSK